MKFVIALVALVHLCYSIDLDVNNEIIERLEKLNKLYQKNQVNITSSNLRVPSRTMQINAKFCVPIFKRELLEFLGNVTVDEDNNHLVEEIEDNLGILKSENETKVEKCTTRAMVKSHTPFKAYDVFLKNLNNSKR